MSGQNLPISPLIAIFLLLACLSLTIALPVKAGQHQELESKLSSLTTEINRARSDLASCVEQIRIFRRGMENYENAKWELQKNQNLKRNCEELLSQQQSLLEQVSAEKEKLDVLTKANRQLRKDMQTLPDDYAEREEAERFYQTAKKKWEDQFKRYATLNVKHLNTSMECRNIDEKMGNLEKTLTELVLTGYSEGEKSPHYISIQKRCDKLWQVVYDLEHQEEKVRAELATVQDQNDQESTEPFFGDSETPTETTTAAAFGDSEATPEYSSTPDESAVPDQPSIDYQAVSDAAAQYQQSNQQTTAPGAQIVVPVEAPWQQQAQQFLQQQALEQSYQQLQQIQQQMQMNSQWMYQTWPAQPQFQPRPPGPQQPVSSLPPSRATRPDKPTVRSQTHQEQTFPPPKPGKPNPFNKPPRVDKPNPFNKPPQANRPPSRTAVQPAPPTSPPPRPAPQNCRQVCAQWRTYIENITDNRTGLCGGKAGRAWSGEIWVICVEKKECVRWETRCY